MTNDEIIFIKESRCSAVGFYENLRMRLKNKTGCGSGTSGRVAEVLFLDESPQISAWRSLTYSSFQIPIYIKAMGREGQE